MSHRKFPALSVRTLSIAMWLAIETAVPSAASDRIALVIGNGAYINATRLKNPGNDATDVARALRDIGFEVIEGRDLDRRAMEERVRAFGEKLDQAKIAVFFYAGHGLQVSGRNYLIPVDAKLRRPGDLSLDTIDIQVVLQQMEAQPRVNLIFLDACRDNPLARRFASTLGASRSAAVGQGLAPIQSAVGTMISFATQPDSVALDGQGRNSPFSAALVEHIRTPGIDVAVMMRRVRNDVLAATAQRQVPWDHSSLTDAVVLVPATGNTEPDAAKPATVAAPNPSPQPSKPTSQELAEAWAATKDTTSIAVLEAFIKRFGRTIYGELARARLAELKAAKAPSQIASAAPVPPVKSEGNVSLCARMVGTWTSPSDLFGETLFKANGTMSQGSFSGTWSCNNGNVSTAWNVGIKDQCKLSGDGRVLSCRNNIGVATTATRKD